ncbi:UDP-N-acetylmuramoyl-L-alanyl-D-glutamate--2,6-diaminopimelate ligase [Rubrivirga sp. S365]|uniref:UDP-N-acetylmuramoyl-L-alanyl-D-glutamate--2,6-diaminopimelate ligase n=1 Tax=Rubrivirga litoralis TaxID=3075598 RepID=A0ABU3BLS2_9BACT|nr:MULTISPECIES: UDP-N-acetylmuramoyl-L-alanyl-D-glutamate--2,6-diaminopimelate ligase [unclassified Rubrivirga]MDT0630208.1 UDP-N-acetylmuramoyl-L-alanyl-D-glutamate--2,6-diaminopimelate ligase [Rubrivirga sp. F394]MDT7855719.1 UDP-N-acetylmuramoyl-L-alanyl-D-glutamate--2,6-diaminopimelate ligase [Rubrivirga sp. S365]
MSLQATPPAVQAAPRALADLVAPLQAGGAVGRVVGDADVLVTDVQIDSRAVTPGALFGAVTPDTHHGRDGHDFVDDALARGAVAALVSDEWLADRPAPSSAPAPLGKGKRLSSAAFVPATDTRAALGEVAAAFYGRPGDALTTLGVTGTNGKTTTVFLIHHLLTALGVTAGLVGTVENRIGSTRYATAFTTPEAPALQRFLRACVDGGCTAAAMEVSSHGLALDRVGGVAFDVAVFTNLSQDHLDYHRTFEEYRDAKKRLFDGLGPDATAVVNGDDDNWKAMVADSAARVVTFGTSEGVDVRVEVLDNSLDGLRLRLGGEERPFQMAGRFNALNLAAAYACGVALGYEGGAVLDALAAAPGVPGRFETVRAGGVVGVVDYAHTPDALDNVLRTAREIVPEGNALWAVFGAGGDRDAGKRPLMARVAETVADRVVLTSDNPRTEDPEAILNDVAAGLDRPARAERVADRADAIRFAAGGAAPGDVVVVAGKGHETYQIVGDERRDFDDRAVLRDALTSRPAR